MDNERVQYLLQWLQILNNGYVKPDANASKSNGTSNTTGIVKDTKDFTPYIDKINVELAETLKVPNVDLTEIQKRRTQVYN